MFVRYAVFSILLSFISVGSYAQDLLYLVAKAKISLSASAVSANSTVNSTTANVALMTLSDGRMYQVSFFGVLSRSYAEILQDWSTGDEIVVTYVGGTRAPVNPYQVENVSRGEKIWVARLSSL